MLCEIKAKKFANGILMRDGLCGISIGGEATDRNK